MEELSKFVFGAIGGGFAATVFRVLDATLQSRREKKQSAQATLRKYAKPLWLAAHALESRLDHVANTLKNRSALKSIPQRGYLLDWYAKDGYYAVSTAYHISAVASWIGLFQRDVVFLEFPKQSQSDKFFRLVEGLQAIFSQSPSILWYQYIDGIGSELIDEGRSQPMTFSAFCRRLSQDESFRLFYDQLFQFLTKLADNRYPKLLHDTLEQLSRIKSCLSDAGAVSGLPAVEDPSF